MCSDSPIGKLSWRLASAVSLKCWQETVYKSIYLFFVAIWLLKDYLKLDFPRHYLWAETFINYEGGFMRRGLMGQLLYYAAPWVNIRFLALLLCTLAFLLFIKLAYDRISQSFDKLTTIILFICPAYFLFFVKDFLAFLRKDQFINLLALITVIATVRHIKKHSESLLGPMLIFTGCFWLSFLIHEGTVFYFTLPAWILGLAFAKRKKTLAWFVMMSVFFISAGLVAIRFPGNAENARVMLEAWQAIYPSFEGMEAFGYIGMSPAELVAETSAYHHNAVAMRSAAWGLFLALLPLAFTCAAYRPFAAMRKSFPTFMCFIFPLAAAAPWAFPFFACDSGRHIALASIQYILALWAIAAVLGLTARQWLTNLLHAIDTNAKTRILTLSSVILYGTSWTLLPWVPVGHSFVILAGIPDFLVYLLAP